MPKHPSRIVRAHGVTAAEQYLEWLCEKTFLSMWSYPGVYRNQKSGKGIAGCGKEVADLIVVFGEHVLIFSDKDCAFPNSSNLQTDWRRWYRRAIEDPARQILGAERWIKSYPDRLFVDNRCTERFPLALPKPSAMRIHRIVVAHDSTQRCKAEMGGSGSLAIKPSVIADAQAFAVGRVYPGAPWVHVLDDISLTELLRTLDTVADFVSYLEKKERFINSGKLKSAASELDLLAAYMGLFTQDGHDFLFPDDLAEIEIKQGEWTRFTISPQRRAQVVADSVSYTWDRLIETFNHHALTGTQHFTSHPGVANQEKGFYWLAREPRVRRRMLAKALVDVLNRNPTSFAVRVLTTDSLAVFPVYVFLLLPQKPNESDEEYRRNRRELLKSYSLVAKLKIPAAKHIVGIATQPGSSQERSEDFFYYDVRHWSEAERKDAERIQKKTGFLERTKVFAGREVEFPVNLPETLMTPRGFIPGRNPRNKLCPCGSKKKYKHCHGA
jgi:hypothetical protein